MSRTIKLFLLFSLVLPLSVLAEEAQTTTSDEPEAAIETAKPAAEPETAVEETAVETTEPKIVQTGTVGRGQFTSGIENREPKDRLESVASGGTVFFFSELRDFAGQTVTHRWVYKGESKAEVSFNVGGNRWRVNSSKNIRSDWHGTWEVQVIGGNETQVGSYTLEVEMPVEPEANAEAETPVEPKAEPEIETTEPDAETETTTESE
ncbi:MAG: DUF2914 domain-containing protein [Gammaproteobacteria bacterium]